MKNRQLLKIHGLSAVCSLIMMLASCSSEEIVPNGTGTDADGDKNLTTFVAVGPEQTRTSMDYTGGDAPFYWEEGDKIYVKDDDGAWKASNAVDAAHAHSVLFRFKVPGKFTKGNTYKVYYPGQNGSNDQVNFYGGNQTAPNTTTHFGTSGDCGIGDATWKDSAKGFAFTLDHQVSILVFQPYTSNSLLKNCNLVYINVYSDHAISGSYKIDPVTGNLIDPTYENKFVALSTISSAYPDGVPMSNATSSITADKFYLLIKPGTHKLRVRFELRNNNEDGTITKNLPSFTYNKNTYYDISAHLDVQNNDGHHYYMWDAKQNYWFGHEWDTADPWQPTLTSQPANSNYPQNNTDNRWYHEGSGAFEASQNPLFNTLPNFNEIAWYVEKGDARWDAYEFHSVMGRLHRGGIWLLKKEKIASRNSTTTAAMKNAAPDGTDYRTTGHYSHSEVVLTPLPPYVPMADSEDYFFLPTSGYYSQGQLYYENEGYYWSSSADHGYNFLSGYLRFDKYGIGADGWHRMTGQMVRAFE